MELVEAAPFVALLARAMVLMEDGRAVRGMSPLEAAPSCPVVLLLGGVQAHLEVLVEADPSPALVLLGGETALAAEVLVAQEASPSSLVLFELGCVTALVFEVASVFSLAVFGLGGVTELLAVMLVPLNPQDREMRDRPELVSFDSLLEGLNQAVTRETGASI